VILVTEIQLPVRARAGIVQAGSNVLPCTLCQLRRRHRRLCTDGCGAAKQLRIAAFKQLAPFAIRNNTQATALPVHITPTSRVLATIRIHPANTLKYHFPLHCHYIEIAFSALTLLVGRQEGHPACKKTEWWSAGVVVRLERGADLHMAQLMPLPLTVSWFSKIQIGFTFLVPAYPGITEKGAVKRVCVLLYRNTFCMAAINCGSKHEYNVNTNKKLKLKSTLLVLMEF